jgi:hypothetical protein
VVKLRTKTIETEVIVTRKVPVPILPDKPSALLAVALADLEKAERSRRYKIDMGTWHNPSANEKTCSVCLAGSIMAFSLKVPPTQDADAWGEGLGAAKKVDPDLTEKLLFIDKMRAGRFSSGVHNPAFIRRARKKTGVTGSVNFQHQIPFYEDDPNGFKRGMRKMIKSFREFGL